MKPARAFLRRATAIVLTAASGFSASPARSADVLDALPGFDRDRVRTILTEPNAERRAAELSRLLYRVRRVPENVWTEAAATPSGPSDAPEPDVDASGSAPTAGQPVRIVGVVDDVGISAVPMPLVEYVEFDRIRRFAVAGRTVYAIADFDIVIGDRVDAVGVSLGRGKVAAGRVRVFPNDPDPDAAALATVGIDAGVRAAIRRAGRGPLTAADSDAFFRLLAVAHRVPPSDASPIEPHRLLVDESRQVGRRLKIDGEIVRVTRIDLSDNRRREQLGTDHYFQSDLMASLGDREVILRPPAGVDGEPATYRGRYPVSVVSLRPPPGVPPDLVSRDVRVPVRVAGIYYRLWSYASDLTRETGGDAIAPLVIASDFQDLTPPPGDGLRVNRIGRWAAAATATGLLGCVCLTLLYRRGDRRAQRVRRRHRHD